MVPIFQMGDTANSSGTYQTTLQLQNEGIVAVVQIGPVTPTTLPVKQIGHSGEWTHRCWHSRDLLLTHWTQISANRKTWLMRPMTPCWVMEVPRQYPLSLFELW